MLVSQQQQGGGCVAPPVQAAAGDGGKEVASGDSPHPQDIVTMQLCANKLDKKDFFGKSDPFLVFYRSNEDGT